jgi:hypothetical protein
VLFGGLYMVQRFAFAPETTLSGYFDALSQHDGKSALSYLEEGITEGPSDNDSGRLQIAPLQGSGYIPPSKLKVEAITETGRTTRRGGNPPDLSEYREAQIEYQLDGSPYKATLTLHRQKETTLGVFHRWRIVGGLSSISVAAPAGTPVVVNGQAVPAAQYGYVLAAFVGRYTVAVGDNPLWTAPATTADVGLSHGAEVQLPVQLKASARSDIEAQVRAYLDECARSTELAPDGCPFSTYSFGTVTDVKWTIQRYPTLAIEQTQEGTLSISTRQSGLASVTGKSSTNSPFSGSDTFYVSGTAELTNSKVHVVIRR